MTETQADTETYKKPFHMNDYVEVFILHLDTNAIGPVAGELVSWCIHTARDWDWERDQEWDWD